MLQRTMLTTNIYRKQEMTFYNFLVIGIIISVLDSFLKTSLTAEILICSKRLLTGISHLPALKCHI